MNNCRSCCSKEDVELSGDMKYMETKYPGSTKKVPDWKKKYRFTGRLVKEPCAKLVIKT